MIDTIKIYTQEFELAKENKFKVNSTVEYSTGELKGEKLYCNFPNFSINVKSEKKRLFLQTSLPKLLYGNSLFEISEGDLEQSIDKIESQINYAGVVIDKNCLNDFYLSRVDFCRNIQVENNIMDYLLLLSQYGNSRRDKVEIKKETVSFRNNCQELVFYNKIREVIEHEKDKDTLKLARSLPENILRIESRLKQKRVIDREVKSKTKFVDLFDWSIAKKKLLKDIDLLVRNSIEQIEFNFKENSELLKFIQGKRERGAFREFLAIKGAEQFLIEFQFDWVKIRDFLMINDYSRAQAYRHIEELKGYQGLILENDKRDLIKEIKFKIAA